MSKMGNCYKQKSNQKTTEVFKEGAEMNLRPAKKEDLGKLENMFISIVEQMNKNGIFIWNEYYPFEEFDNDIDNHRLYLLVEGELICSAFVLFDDIEGSDCFDWKNKKAKAKYMGRFGVNTEFLRKGIGSKTIQYAKDICKKTDVEFLRLTVAKNNYPAISLYLKNHFVSVDGEYKEFSPTLAKTIVEAGYELEI